MTKARTRAWVRRTGLAAGVAVAVVALLAWRVPHSNGILGLDLRITAAQDGEVEASPLTPFLSATGMKRGDVRHGSFTLRNLTARVLSLRLRASAPVRDADRSLRLRLATGSAILFDGPLADLRGDAARPLALARGHAQRIDVTASVPASAVAGFEGRILDVELEHAREGAR